MQQLYQIIENEVIFKDGKVIKFERGFRQTLVIENMLILIVNIINNENVYGVDLKSQDITWQIENKREDSCSFTDMIEGKDKHLYLRSWCHLILDVNPKTGEIYSKEYDTAK